jgi:hypothetical protein
MEEVAEDGKESTNSAHANGMNMNCTLYSLPHTGGVVNEG